MRKIFDTYGGRVYICGGVGGIKMVIRDDYLSKLISFKDKDVIKVVTGVRHCGKSTLFLQYIDWLKTAGVADVDIVLINFEDLDYEGLRDYKLLYKYISERLPQNRTAYVFLDEVQNCAGFEKVADSLFIKGNVDLHITGSNAYMLSGELATLLSGRYVTVDMLPFSFKEYCMAQAGEKSLEEYFNDYLRFGAFPYVSLQKRDMASVMPYIEGIFNTIVIKDIASRHGINDIPLLESIIKFAASNIGSCLSPKKITDTLISSGRKVSYGTVDAYLHALTESYIFYKADRYDIKGRQHLKTLSKYYLVDTAIRSLLLSGASADIGHLIENIVYFELLRRGGRVNVGKLGESEVDFVCSSAEGVSYFQVSASVLDPATLERELAPLKKISDSHPKFLLTLDKIGTDSNYDGIRQKYLPDWLSN